MRVALGLFAGRMLPKRGGQPSFARTASVMSTEGCVAGPLADGDRIIDAWLRACPDSGADAGIDHHQRPAQIARARSRCWREFATWSRSRNHSQRFASWSSWRAAVPVIAQTWPPQTGEIRASRPLPCVFGPSPDLVIPSRLDLAFTLATGVLFSRARPEATRLLECVRWEDIFGFPIYKGSFLPEAAGGMVWHRHQATCIPERSKRHAGLPDVR
jgi:hypothetical protein